MCSQRQRFGKRPVESYHSFIRRMRKSRNHQRLQLVWESAFPQSGSWLQPWRRPWWGGSYGCACRASEACSGNTNDNEAGSQVWSRYFWWKVTVSRGYVYFSFKAIRWYEALKRLFTTCLLPVHVRLIAHFQHLLHELKHNNVNYMVLIKASRCALNRNEPPLINSKILFERKHICFKKCTATTGLATNISSSLVLCWRVWPVSRVLF